jgi:hypothetical protein
MRTFLFFEWEAHGGLLQRHARRVVVLGLSLQAVGRRGRCVTAASKVLDRLAGVKQTAPGRWISRCPAHEDKSPSLSIRETEDGRVLLYCFAACGAGDVLDSIGLCMSDLFDQPIAHHMPPLRGGFSARELLELNSHEALVAADLASSAQRRPLTEEEQTRLVQAAARLSKAQAMTNGR